MIEEVPEWTETATAAVRQGLDAFDAANVAFEVVPLPEVSDTEEEIINEHVALYDMVAATAHEMITTGGPAWQHKASRFDYTLGDGLAFLAERSGADGTLIVIGAESVSSAGRSALSIFSAVLSAYAGAYTPLKGGSTFLTAGLVDLRTGDILWFNFDSKFKAGRDIRKTDIAVNAVKELLDPLPKQPGVTTPETTANILRDSVPAAAGTVSSDGLLGDWGGRFESSISWWPNGEIKLRITENDNENYTGHVLKIPEGNPSLTCEGAPINLNRGGGNRYAVSFNRRNACQAEGEFVYTGQTLNGEVLFGAARRRVKISLTRLSGGTLNRP